MSIGNAVGHEVGGAVAAATGLLLVLLSDDTDGESGAGLQLTLWISGAGASLEWGW